MPGRQLTSVPARTWTRSLATEVDLESIARSIDSIDHELQGALQQTKSIESQVQNDTYKLVPQIDSRTHVSRNLKKDGTAKFYESHRRSQKLTKPLGTVVSKLYEPHALVKNPPRPSDITIELLLASQSHMGHKTSHWNPGNSRYIFGIRQGIHIISPDVTAAHLRRACRVVSGVAERGGLILFVGTRPGQDRCVVKAAELAGGCHLFERWTPGGITNGHQILGTCRTKVVDEHDREIPGFDQRLMDRPVLKPDLVVVLNPIENWILLHECGLNAIPTIGIVDTDADPTWVTYPIPANDDSMRCVQVLAGVLGRAGQEGQESRRELAKEGKVTYIPATLAEDDAAAGVPLATGGDAGNVYGVGGTGSSNPGVSANV